jgi:hypothetical protein
VPGHARIAVVAAGQAVDRADTGGIEDGDEALGRPIREDERICAVDVEAVAGRIDGEAAARGGDVADVEA